MSTETLTFENGNTPLDLLLFRRFRKEVPGLVEQTLAQNPGLAAFGTYPPRGTKIIITPPIPATKRVVRKTIKLYN